MDIKELKSQYLARKKEIQSRLGDFKKNKDIFYELCFCTLTPQSSAYKCDACIQILKRKRFQKEDFRINEILRNHTRFHNNKSNYLLEIKKNWKEIEKNLSSTKTGEEKRDYLFKNIKGLGLKEASHFLRNTGHENLAILDRHILKNLVKLGVLKELPKALTPKVYLDIEKKFKGFSDRIDIPMDELDLLFWSMETGKVFK